MLLTFFTFPWRTCEHLSRSPPENTSQVSQFTSPTVEPIYQHSELPQWRRRRDLTCVGKLLSAVKLNAAQEEAFRFTPRAIIEETSAGSDQIDHQASRFLLRRVPSQQKLQMVGGVSNGCRVGGSYPAPSERCLGRTLRECEWMFGGGRFGRLEQVCCHFLSVSSGYTCSIASPA